MKIIIGKTAGFCFGVLRAVNETDKLLNNKKNVCCLGELVHNRQVIEELENKGLKTIKDINESGEVTIIRAHGEPLDTYKKADKLGINLYDLTCPKVLKIHNIATEYANNGYYIFLIGHKEHPETIGTISYCGKNADIIQNSNEIDEKLDKFYNSHINKLLILVQTTYRLEKFNEIVSVIKENLRNNSNINIEVKNTICNATKLRQEETKQIACQVDIMIIVGGRNSSNTNKLYQISKKYCKESLLIENEKELNIDYIKKFNKVGLMAGASTPQKSIDLVVEKLEHI